MDWSVASQTLLGNTFYFTENVYNIRVWKAFLKFTIFSDDHASFLHLGSPKWSVTSEEWGEWLTIEPAYLVLKLNYLLTLLYTSSNVGNSFETHALDRYNILLLSEYPSTSGTAKWLLRNCYHISLELWRQHFECSGTIMASCDFPKQGKDKIWFVLFVVTTKLPVWKGAYCP